MQTSSSRRLTLVTALLLCAVLGWDVSGLDLPLARLSGGPAGFPLQQNWLLDVVLHQGARWLSWLVALWMVAGVWRPTGWLRRIGAAERRQLAITLVLAVLLISGLKRMSLTSCPSDLAEFGRSARYVSHWALFSGPDGAGGHCFPAGHASAAFAFVGGYFAFRRQAPQIARGWLLGSLVAGFTLGWAQQLRGAHFMSHTLWTAWLCWATALMVDRWNSRRRTSVAPMLLKGGVG
jgi:membrane-associated PAP2 superfamily phosphatase